MLALEILSRLRLKGFLLSIDDFGTGFSSLETLYKLPFGELKIDKGFVFDLLKSNEARTLVESTVSLARKLGLKIWPKGWKPTNCSRNCATCNATMPRVISSPSPLPPTPSCRSSRAGNPTAWPAPTVPPTSSRPFMRCWPISWADPTMMTTPPWC